MHEVTDGLSQPDGQNHTFGCLSNQVKLKKTHLIKRVVAPFLVWTTVGVFMGVSNG